MQPMGRHRLVWGFGYRHSRDRVTNSFAQAILPANRNLHWENVFVQDDVALRPNLTLTVGAKLERNVYTGGVVSTQANSPRQIQFGLKLLF